MKGPNERMQKIPFTGGIREILNKATQLEQQGRSIIHMEIGRPDFDSPKEAKDKVVEALQEGFVHYTSLNGIAELREAIAGRTKDVIGLEVDPQDVIITAGAVEGLIAAMLVVLDPGDEVLVPRPCFPAYFDQIVLAGGRMVSVPTKMEKGFRLDVEDLEARITPKSKMLLINSPNNPTGAMLEKEDLEKIADLAKKHDLIVVSDECYDEFVYDGEHISIASLPGMRDRTIIVNAASKTFSMTGWRIGFIISPPHLTNYLIKTHQNLSTCANSFAQVGAAAAYKHSRGYTREMVKEFKRRRDLVVKYLDEIKGIEYVKPKGAFYVFPSIKELNMSSMDFCEYILNEAGVAIVPGEAFGDQYGKQYVRIAYASSYEDIKEGMERIKQAVERL